jgi:hypothetical protein
MPKSKQTLGRAVSILAAFDRQCHAEYDDLAAFHAPSECADIVDRGQRRRFRQVRRHACHVAGVKNLNQMRRAVKRAVPTWDRYNHFRLGIESI